MVSAVVSRNFARHYSVLAKKTTRQSSHNCTFFIIFAEESAKIGCASA